MKFQNMIKIQSKKRTHERNTAAQSKILK